MTEEQAYHAVGLLIGGVKMWPEAATDAFVEQFQKHADDADAMIEVCERIALTWGARDGRPGLGEVLDEYRKHPRVAAEREARVARALLATAPSTDHCDGSRWIPLPDDPELRHRPCPRCNPFLADLYADPVRYSQWANGTDTSVLHDSVTRNSKGEVKTETPMPEPCKRDTRYDPERFPSYAEGMEIMRAEYRSVYGRDIGDEAVPDPAWAETLIQDDEHYDVAKDVWYSTYVSVLRGFRGDHKRTQASLKALGRRLVWDNRGRLTLKPPPETPQATQEPRYDPPPVPDTPEPADGLVDAGSLMRDAIGATIKSVEGD